MSGQEIQIAELAKQGLNAAEIAEALGGYRVEDIEQVLAVNEEVRRDIDKATLNKLDAEFASLEMIAVQTLKQVMLSGDKDSARIAAANYVLDQRLGLKQPKVGIQIIDTDSINSIFRAVKDRKRELDKQIVDIESRLVEAQVA